MEGYPLLEEYLAGAVGNCPRCKSESISCGSYEETDAAIGVMFPVTCGDCGATWWDVYGMTAVFIYGGSFNALLMGRTIDNPPKEVWADPES